MKLLLSLTLLLFLLLPGSASSAPRGRVFQISLCGTFHSETSQLALGAQSSVDLSFRSAAPEKAGTYCFRGSDLLALTDKKWKLNVTGFGPVPESPTYPVLICARMEKDFSAPWNGERLWFKGPFPPLKDGFWCGDGKALPSRIDNGWYFENDRFRKSPNPDQRSGMSIGNQ